MEERKDFNVQSEGRGGGPGHTHISTQTQPDICLIIPATSAVYSAATGF